MGVIIIMSCEYCNYADLDKTNLNIICKKHDIKVSLTTSKCDEYILREDLLKERSCCGVCEYMLMDEYCAKHEKYTLHDDKPCSEFEPCEEYLAGGIGW